MSLVILLGNMHFLMKKLEIWIHMGVGHSQRYINISKLYRKLGEKLCKALAAFHAFTGCDFNPSFYRKGKNRPFKIFENSEKYINAFIKISDLNNALDDVFPVFQEYTCEIYGLKKMQDVNLARVAVFHKTYRFDGNKEDFPTVFKNIDGSTLPPCKSELKEHLKRTGYISHIWSHSYLPEPIHFSPLEYGWEETDCKYGFQWFEGDEVPQSVSEISVQNELDETEVPNPEVAQSSDDEDEDDDEIHLGEEKEEEDINEETSEYDTDTSSIL